MNTWLVAYLFVGALHLLRTSMIVLIWLRAKDPSVS